MEKINVNSLLEQMQKMAASASQNKQEVEKSEGFSQVLGTQIDKVNQMQMEAKKLQEDFTVGKPGVSLPQVMIASQKSSVYTQFLIESRNKLIAAYNDIMNMSV